MGSTAGVAYNAAPMFKALPVVLLCATVALAQSNPELEKANRFLFDQKFAEASRALDAAARVTGNGRELTLRIYELQGVVYGQLGQATKAREAFQALLSLDPKRELNGKYNQKVVAAFSAAKEWANTNPPLDFKAAKAAIDEKGRVMQLAAKVKNDSMRLVRKVRFHLRPDDARWSEQDSEIQGVYAAANTEALGVEWWAELLGDNDRVLLVVGSESNPVREGKARDRPAVVADAPKKEEVKATPKKKVEPEPPEEKGEKKAEVKPDAIVDETPASPSSPLRPVGYVLMGVGVAGVAVGAFFGYQSSATRSKILNASRDSEGRVNGITQKEGFMLGPQAQSQAVVANVMFGVGGGVALAGGILWLVGGSSSESASVSVSPTVGGVVANGTF